jgi:hypothetical protein
MKLYHWNTTLYSRHKSSDNFIEKFIDITDRFVEVFIGRYKVKPLINNIITDVNIITDDGIIYLLNKSRDYLEKLNDTIKDSELLNIRDELLAEINQTLYLFTFK